MVVQRERSLRTELWGIPNLWLLGRCREINTEDGREMSNYRKGETHGSGVPEAK